MLKTGIYSLILSSLKCFKIKIPIDAGQKIDAGAGSITHTGTVVNFASAGVIFCLKILKTDIYSPIISF